MPPTRTFNNRSFYPFPIDYSSETFAPLIRSDCQIAHVRYLLHGQHAAQARFQHYLTTCATIFALEKTLQDLQSSHDYVFAEFITLNVVHRLQPFLIQTQRRSQIPPSTAVITNVRRQQQTQTPTPPTTTTNTVRPDQPTSTVRIPHAFHDNIPIVVTVPNVTSTPPLQFPLHWLPLLDTFPLSSPDLILVSYVALPPMVTTLVVPSEVGAFTVSRGVVLQPFLLFISFVDILFYICLFFERLLLFLFLNVYL